MDIKYRIIYQAQKRLVNRLEKLLEREKRKRQRYERLYRYEKKRLKDARKAAAELNDYVIEWCVHCETQVTMLWNPEKDGLSAFCPHCGSVMMLCDSCIGECDYDGNIDVCKEM